MIGRCGNLALAGRQYYPYTCEVNWQGSEASRHEGNGQVTIVDSVASEFRLNPLSAPASAQSTPLFSRAAGPQPARFPAAPAARKRRSTHPEDVRDTRSSAP